MTIILLRDFVTIICIRPSYLKIPLPSWKYKFHTYLFCHFYASYLLSPGTCRHFSFLYLCHYSVAKRLLRHHAVEVNKTSNEFWLSFTIYVHSRRLQQWLWSNKSINTLAREQDPIRGKGLLCLHMICKTLLPSLPVNVDCGLKNRAVIMLWLCMKYSGCPTLIPPFLFYYYETFVQRMSFASFSNLSAELWC